MMEGGFHFVLFYMWPCFFPEARHCPCPPSRLSVASGKKLGQTLQQCSKGHETIHLYTLPPFPSLNVWQRSPWSQTLFKCTTKELDTYTQSALLLSLSIPNPSSLCVPHILSSPPVCDPLCHVFFFTLTSFLLISLPLEPNWQCHTGKSSPQSTNYNYDCHKLTTFITTKTTTSTTTTTITAFDYYSCIYYWHLSDQLTGGISSFIIEVVHSWNST